MIWMWEVNFSDLVYGVLIKARCIKPLNVHIYLGLWITKFYCLFVCFRQLTKWRFFRYWIPDVCLATEINMIVVSQSKDTFCTIGVETTRHFLLEWLSYTHRYIPVGLLDVIPQRLNWRSPSYFGRDDLETLMASDSAADWVCIVTYLGPFIIY